ncbi:MAG: DNA primase [Gemmatimonadales bacterium]
MIPDEIIEQVRDSADLVGIIGEGVNLKRTGGDYRGACPFHGGTHRNFAVIPKKGLYYCYVCHAGGDVFTYLMRRFGMDYPTAVREVARRAGITIPEQGPKAGPDPREPLFGAVALAHDFFTRQLFESPDASHARKYLESRDLDLDAVRPLGLGFAPPGDGMMKELSRHEIPEAVLLEAGLLYRRDDGRVIPRFRGRLLFPIHDLRGRVVGFGGRILGSGEPKYLNSPETPIFHKGSMLYNLHQAKQAIRKAEEAIVVEGYMDVLRLVLAGIEHVVAPLGTALTADQAALLKRFTSTVILAYDSDTAGQRATFRAADELLRLEVRVRVVTMPEGEDPDSLVRKDGARGMEAVVRDAADVMERKLQVLEEKGWFRDLEHRREALDRLLPTVRAARDPITRDLYLGLIAERTGVGKDILAEELASRPAPRPTPPPPPEEPRGRPVARKPVRRRGDVAERDLLRVIVQFDGWLERAADDIRPEWLEQPEAREVFQALLDARARELPMGVVEALSPGAQKLWNAVQVPLSGIEAATAGDVYENAREDLAARPEFRDYEAIRLRMGRASEDEKLSLTSEMTRLRKELEARYPSAWRKYFYGPVGKRLRQVSPDGR